MYNFDVVMSYETCRWLDDCCLDLASIALHIQQGVSPDQALVSELVVWNTWH